MNDWYGLYVDGELLTVLRWRASLPPDVLDFGRGYSTESEYQVLPVRVTPLIEPERF